ncbi:hypothetical protein MC885_015302, partial [Smutsia gigantea]
LCFPGPGLCLLLHVSGVGAQKTKSPCLRCPLNASCVNDTYCTCNPGHTSESGQEFFTFPFKICKALWVSQDREQPDLLSPQMTWVSQTHMTLHDIDPPGAGQAHAVCVHGEIVVGERNVQTLLPAASLLQLNGVRDGCCEFLLHQLDPSTCLGIQGFADTHSCRDLLKAAHRYVVGACSPSMGTVKRTTRTDLWHVVASMSTCWARVGVAAVGNRLYALQGVVKEFESLLTNKTLWETIEKREITSRVTSVLQEVERNVLKTALNSPEQKIQKVRNSAVAVETRVVTDNCSEGEKIFNLSTRINSVNIYCSDVIQGNVQGPSAVAFISYSSLGNIINATFFEEMNEKDRVYLTSQVVSTALGPKRNTSLSNPVTLSFQHVKMKPSTQKSFCVYWKTTEEGGHAGPEEDPVLTVISYAGLSLSLLCLFLAALTFLLCKAMHNTSTSLHLQLSLCLFLTAVDRTKPEALMFCRRTPCPAPRSAVRPHCGGLTLSLPGLLHLDAAGGSAPVPHCTQPDGGQLLQRGSFMKWLVFPGGYGVPGMIVAIWAASRPHLCGTHERCWLNLDQGFIWGFLGPVCAIICVNLVFFLLVLWILKKKLSSLNTKVPTIQNIR